MIIENLLDTDLYKFTMQQAVLHRFPALDAEFAFRCRNTDVDLTAHIDEIKDEVDHLCSIQFKDEELQFLKSLRFMKSDYIDFLKIFKLNREFIHINSKEGRLDIRIKGPWLHTILFEVPVLAIVNEVYFRNTDPEPDYSLAMGLLSKKIDIVKENSKIFRFADFGTRRRRSREWQREIIETLVKKIGKNFIGTSNVLFAMENSISPIGTMAHEFLQACQATEVRLVDSQKFALECWVQEYRGDLGIALSDVVGMDAFLRDFDLYFCKLFDGARHDSGDPYVWCDKLIDHYGKMKVDPATKTAVFSDGLDFKKARDIALKYGHKINVVFGIGTNLTNDFGDEPLQIVIKMTKCNGQHVAKISDTPGKTICEDDSFISYLKGVFKIKD
ncbi:nicotinate phosphoribosyltransferase [Spirochaetota bacterium]